MRRLFLLIFIILFLIIISISFLNYKTTKETIENKYYERRGVVEESILKSFNYVNDAYKIAEKQLNKEMKRYSLLLRKKYRDNPDVKEWDLEKLKEKFNGFDVYIINEDLKVIRSTFKKDIGLDFTKFPSFSQELEKRLKKDTFTVDRLDLETKTGNIKKYSYISSPDHKYLLELGVDLKKTYPTLKKLNIFNEAYKLTKKYESVAEISFYKYSPQSKRMGEVRNTLDPIDTDIPDWKKDFIARTYENNQTLTTKNNSKESPYVHTFLPILVSENGNEGSWWDSFVVSIKYDNSMKNKEIIKHRNLFLINGIIMIAILTIFLLMVIYLLKRFEFLAYHDNLTGLPNRKLFEDKINKFKKKYNKNKDDSNMALLFINIDNFKEINNNFGHETGDKILKNVADKLNNKIKKKDYISRLGSDEFLVAITQVSSKNNIVKEVEEIIDVFEQPIEIKGSKFFISITLGVSIYPKHSNNIDELIKKADDAMYKAKQQQKDFIIYNRD